MILEEIGPVASSLITDDSIPFFLNNYDLIYNIWIFFLSARAIVYSIEDTIITVFDVLYHLIDIQGIGLLLQFAYIQLADTINILVNTVSTEYCAGYIY